MAEENFPYKVWNYDRSLKKSVTARTLKELIEKGCSKLGLDPTRPIDVVQEEDGVRVTNEGYFSCLPGFTTFLFLQNDEQWRPGEIEARDETDASDVVDKDLARLIASLKWDMANIMLFSIEQLQKLVNLDTSHLAKLLGRYLEYYACTLQEEFHYFLYKHSRNNELADVLKLYHRLMSSTGQSHGGEAESAPQFVESGQ
ncbi:hypothetical protein BsWGS_25937 [Bradybaena similaris]